MRVAICGGGAIGACTAFFLSLRGIEVIVIERAEVAVAASGKAGGFLALDWCAGTPLDALARRASSGDGGCKPTRLAGAGRSERGSPTALIIALDATVVALFGVQSCTSGLAK